MANLATLKAALNAAIYQNNQNAITGEALNTVLNSIIDTLGAGYRYAGVATPSANPGTIDNRVFYLATAAGTYTNFGAAVLDGKSLHVFIYDTTWHNVALDVPTTAALPQPHNVDWSYLINTFDSQSIENIPFRLYSMGTPVSGTTKYSTALAQFLGLSAQATPAEVRTIIVNIITNGKSLKDTGNSGVRMNIMPTAADNINPAVLHQNLIAFEDSNITADKCSLAARYEICNGWQLILFASASDVDPYCGLFLQPKKNIFAFSPNDALTILDYMTHDFRPLSGTSMYGLNSDSQIRNAFLRGEFNYIWCTDTNIDFLYPVIEAECGSTGVVKFSAYGGIFKYVLHANQYYFGPEDIIFYDGYDNLNIVINRSLMSAFPKCVYDLDQNKMFFLNSIAGNPTIYDALCDACVNAIDSEGFDGPLTSIWAAYGELSMDKNKEFSYAISYILFSFLHEDNEYTGIIKFEY